MKSLNKLFLPLLLPLLFVVACSPDYPKCDSDSDCAKSEKGKAAGKLMCVNGLCQQCVEDSDCSGEGVMCNAGMCEQIPGYCSGQGDCPNGQKCRNNRCGSECLGPDECGEGKRCEGGKCVADVECSGEADCGPGIDCVDGKCVDPNAGKRDCTLETVYFDYNSAVLPSGTEQTLQANAECLKENNMNVRLAGHTDERGTEEYNLALGERRARNVYTYLVQMGVKPDSISIISYGEEDLAANCGENGSESCHQKNRRVVFTRR